MQIDLILDSRLGPDELALLGSMAEDYGLGALWTASYLDSRDPYANLALLARATRRIRLGPVAVNPWDTHPVRIASSLLTLNELAGGRASIIIGGGGEALQSLGITPQPRVGAVRECVEILKAAGAKKALDYDGQCFRVRGYHPRWALAPAPSVHVAANKPQMLKMAARVADGVMLSDLPPSLVRSTVAQVERHREEAGRADSPFMYSNFMAWHLYADRGRAMREARRWLGYRGLFRRWVITTFLDDADYDLIEAHRDEIYAMALMDEPTVPGVPGRILDALVDNLTLAGGLDEVPAKVDHLRALKAAGLTHVALELREEPAQSIRIIGEQVAPALA